MSVHNISSLLLIGTSRLNAHSVHETISSGVLVQHHCKYSHQIEKKLYDFIKLEPSLVHFRWHLDVGR